MKISLVTSMILAASVVFGAVDISGKWQAEFDTQIGKQNYTFTFRVVGEKLIGIAESEIMGEKHKADLKDVKVVGEEVSFVEMLDFQGNAISISYKGKISGDEIKFTRQVGEFATEELVAKRLK